jgi:hypothetical protein
MPIISVKSLTGVDAGRREPSDTPAKQIVTSAGRPRCSSPAQPIKQSDNSASWV